MFPDKMLPDGTAAPNPAVKMFVLPKREQKRGAKTADRQRQHQRQRHAPAPSRSRSASQQQQQQQQQGSPSTSDDDDNPETATTPIQAWSPLPAERSSTPPFESASTAAGLALTRYSTATVDTPSGGGGSGGVEDGGSSHKNWLLRAFGRRSGPAEIAPEPPSDPLTLLPPAGAVAAAAVRPSSEHHDGEAGPPRSPFAGAVAGALDPFPSTPSVFGSTSGFGDNGDGDGDNAAGGGGDEAAAVPRPSSARAAAARRAAPEADVEEGGLPGTNVPARAAVGGNARVGEARAATAAVGAAPAARAGASVAAEPAVIENGIVLPRPPSDEEKVLTCVRAIYAVR